ncbi:MAG: KUP/HAK/KT family potassium transporter [Steroidobacteraceae bacterium]
MKPQPSSTAAVIGALGTVYGDIGTSPLYAFRETLHATGDASAAAVFGVLSLTFWSLTLIVTLKYVVLILRADNAGEGGILAMLALLQHTLGRGGRWATRVVLLASLGAALFYCDALITPAISVLSAVEGLELLSPQFHGTAVPVTIAIVIVLFAVQYQGTGRIGRSFGYVMILWFLVLAVLGAVALARHPAVLGAVNPWWALRLIVDHPQRALAILSGVFLVVTGGEALYADMGHFGRRPVQAAWLALVWPALLLNYFGQGALVLGDASRGSEPFYALAPAAALPALVVLATAATIIASQATISGAFSVTRQAVQLDLLPRLRILQTSEHTHGQIYVPAVNLFLCVAVILFVIGFRSSGALSIAYGTSVVGTMLITTVLGAGIALANWEWPRWRVAAVFGPLLLVDVLFVAANTTKLASGGGITVGLALVLFGVFLTWRDGRQRLRRRLQELAVPMPQLPALLAKALPVPGAAVFLVSNGDFVPTALLRNLEHNRVRHELIIILHFVISTAPRVDPLARARLETLWPGVMRLRAEFGFMETPNLGDAMRCARLKGLRLPPGRATYFVGWHLVRARLRTGWQNLRMQLFARMQRRSAQAAEFFLMPQDGVVMLGTEVDI